MLHVLPNTVYSETQRRPMQQTLDTSSSAAALHAPNGHRAISQKLT